MIYKSKLNTLSLLAFTLGTLPITVPAITSTSCSNVQTVNIKFEVGSTGIELLSPTLISIKKGTKFKDISLPEYKLSNNYFFDFWKINGLIAHPDDVLDKDTTVVAFAGEIATEEFLTYNVITPTTGEKYASVIYIRSEEKNIVVPSHVEDNENGDLIPVKEINGNALEYATNVETISFPYTVDTFSSQFEFNDANYLKQITIDINNPTYTSRDASGNECNAIIIKNENELFQQLCPPITTKIVIPEGITKISSKAFWGYTKFTEVSFPSSLKEIGTQAFAGSNIETAILPDSLESVGISAFEECLNLSSVKLPRNSTVDMGFNCFKNSGLKSINFPAEIKKVPNILFGCKKLLSANIEYGVESLEDDAFFDCTSLSSIVIPDSVTLYGARCFRSCESMTSAILSKNAPIIPSEMFFNCKNYKQLKSQIVLRQLAKMLSKAHILIQLIYLRMLPI